MAFYGLLVYSDNYKSVIDLASGTIKRPRKDVEDYKAGDYVVASFKQDQCAARISAIHGE